MGYEHNRLWGSFVTSLSWETNQGSLFTQLLELLLHEAHAGFSAVNLSQSFPLASWVDQIMTKIVYSIHSLLEEIEEMYNIRSLKACLKS